VVRPDRVVVLAGSRQEFHAVKPPGIADRSELFLDIAQSAAATAPVVPAAYSEPTDSSLPARQPRRPAGLAHLQQWGSVFRR
jgi:hypothetical protein